jgi:hypothetical protein
VARICDVHRFTAKTAYLKGWSEEIRSKRPALRPIHDILLSEDSPELVLLQPGGKYEPKPEVLFPPSVGPPTAPSPSPPAPEVAPAALAEPAPRRRQKPAAAPDSLEVIPLVPVAPMFEAAELATHAYETVRKEWAAIEANRDTALGLTSIARQVAVALQEKAVRLKSQVEQEIALDTPVDEKQLVMQLQRLGNLVEQASKIISESVKAERLVVGSPTSIHELVRKDVISDEDDAPVAPDGLLASLMTDEVIDTAPEDPAEEVDDGLDD